MIIFVTPLGDVSTVKNDDLEEGVEEENRVGPDGARIEEDGLRGSFEGITSQSWLNHEERIGAGFTDEDVAEEGGFVGGAIKSGQEL